MQISIRRNARQELLLNKNVLKRPSLKVFLLLAAMILLGLLLMLLVSYEVNGVKAPFWNFGRALGLGYIMLGISKIRDFIKRRALSLNHNTDSVIIIDEDKIHFTREMSECTYKWNYFQHYRMNSEFLLLAKDANLNQFVAIGRDEISQDEFVFIELQVSKYRMVKS